MAPSSPCSHFLHELLCLSFFVLFLQLLAVALLLLVAVASAAPNRGIFGAMELPNHINHRLPRRQLTSLPGRHLTQYGYGGSSGSSAYGKIP
jgi:hypothetical protein